MILVSFNMYDIFLYCLVFEMLICASYAISQNSDNAESLKTNLAAIVPHAFGQHDNVIDVV